MVQLICLFTAEETLDHTVSMIVKTYEVVYDRIFVLSIEESKELVCSFNYENWKLRPNEQQALWHSKPAC